jgi:hypothetical protein
MVFDPLGKFEDVHILLHHKTGFSYKPPGIWLVPRHFLAA